MLSDVVYARMWTFTDWWAGQVRIALRTCTGSAAAEIVGDHDLAQLRDRLDHLLELAGDRL